VKKLGTRGEGWGESAPNFKKGPGKQTRGKKKRFTYYCEASRKKNQSGMDRKAKRRQENL